VSGELLGALTSTDELMEATGDRAWLAAMLDAEAALAHAEAAAEVIPAEAAGAIAAACHPDGFDAAEVGRRARAGANPVIPLVADLRARVGPESGEWVHWGATSQDILDTAAMLVCRRTLAIIETDMAHLAASCAVLAGSHRDAPMVARTLLQQALPTTFGLKAAGWLAGVMDAGDGLARLRPRLAAQLGGAAGTLAAFGDAGIEVMARMAVALDLVEPVVPWHTARGRIAEIAGALGVAAGAAAKVALDVVLMAQTEVGEVAEGGGAGAGGSASGTGAGGSSSATGAGGSSTLPHKRNPAGAVRVLAAARRAEGLAATLLGGMAQEHERAAGTWQAEWATLADLLATAGGAVATAGAVVSALEVDTAALRANLDATGGLVLAERVTFALAATLGRDAAAAAVTAAAARSAEAGPSLAGAPLSFADALAGDAVVVAALGGDESTGEIGRLLDPVGYMGSAGALVDRVLDAYEAWGTP